MALWQIYGVGLLAVAATITACSPSVTPPVDERPGSSAIAAEFGQVHAVGLNPTDGSVLVATQHGVFRIDPRGAPVQIIGRAQDTVGFTVTGEDRILASGHPGGPEAGTANLGLIVSEDAARTWTPVALSGVADFHALSAVGVTIYGFDSVTGSVMRSDDNGQHWHHGATFVTTDLDVDPTDPLRVLATTPSGLRKSIDGGVTFSLVQPQPPRPLLLVDHIVYTVDTDRVSTVAGVDASGGVWALGDAGWEASGALPGAPTAFTAVAPARFLAAAGEHVLSSEDAGRSWRVLI
jgi:hypothetical protein